MIVGVGVDIVDLARFRRHAERTPELLERLFAATELLTPEGGRRPWPALAVGFAAKEAAAKALGGPAGIDWHDIAVGTGPAGDPTLVLTGRGREVADRLGITRWRLALGRGAGVAYATAIAECGAPREDSPDIMAG